MKSVVMSDGPGLRWSIGTKSAQSYASGGRVIKFTGQPCLCGSLTNLDPFHALIIPSAPELAFSAECYALASTSKRFIEPFISESLIRLYSQWPQSSQDQPERNEESKGEEDSGSLDFQ